MLQARFPAKSQGASLDSTIFSILTVPDEAKWLSSKYDLQEVFASHPVEWDSQFDYVSRTSDMKIPELYKKGLLQCKAAAQFVAFNKAKVDHFNGRKSYPWIEKGETLASFMANVRSGRAGKVHFVVQERSGAMTINSPWGRSTTPLNKAGPFVAQFTPELMKTLYNSKSDDDEFNSQSDSQLFFRRRRRRRAPPPPTVIHIKSEKFHMDFKSNGLTGISIAPGKWFDVNWIRSNKQCLNSLIARGRPLALIPKVAWVAFQPHITLKVSHTEWQRIKTLWNNPMTVGLAVGGNFFRQRNYRKALMADEKAFASLSKERQEFYADDAMANHHADEVEFNVETREKTVLSELKDTATFNRKTITRIVHDDEEDLVNANSAVASENQFVLEDEEVQSESMGWRRRRRRRRAPPPPPPPKKIYEKVYTVTLKSTSPYPEIIAVTSQKVASL
eukprot:CAMPEP_0117428830 /NCGR_PEP_ID=MMETSP0758-20121206/8450_1 /TAXON_ID=63605 /ORGANISM="Percolomonas cosmopolitus, Strain AE-1 (ATCC 50343)" /LENGTH=446 /DNA_ID=CAMNT_0005215403 /DNA_START=55 /DNA_END=1395 /DNA_ORIENTATION=-